MSTVLGIMGQSGHGKTTAMRTLDPASTYYIDSDRKGLSWRGWTQQYRAGVNYLRSSDAQEISATLRKIDSGMPQIRQVVIDTANGIMLDSEMGRIREHGYGKWTELAADVYDLITLAGQLRNDLIVIVGFHVQPAADGEGVDHILTNGRKLEKVHLETKLPMLLYAKCLTSDSGNQYVLETQARGSTAKTPLGLFDAAQIPNDMRAVCDAVRVYQEGDVPENAVKGSTAPAQGQETSRQPRSEEPAADVDELLARMEQAGISPIIMSRYCSAEKRQWLRDGDLDMSHIAPDKVSGIIANWDRVVAACKALTQAVDPFASVNGIRRAAEVSGISEDDLNRYAEAKASLGFRMPWYETDVALLDKLGDAAVWERATKWMVEHRADLPF